MIINYLYKLISARLTFGWDIEKAVKTPKMAHKL
jgi:hypothetical protein